MYKISLTEVRKRGREEGRKEGKVFKKAEEGSLPCSRTVTVYISPKLLNIFSAITFKTPTGCFFKKLTK